MLLTVDSFSRRHFFRKLPNTVDYLRSLKNSSFEVYDFKLHNIVGDDSANNMIPILGNTTEPLGHDEYDGDRLGAGALWKIFKRAGYMTLVGFETCSGRFVQQLGQSPRLDHLIYSFYCASRQFLKVSQSKYRKLEQRCVGEHMSHYYMLNYTQAFSQLYPDTNQWIYVHTDAAHEATGLHAVTLDADLVPFLRHYVEVQAQTHDITIFLHADHGMRYGQWTTKPEGSQEHKLPALFVIASKKVLDKYPHARQALHHNSLTLTSKKDLRASMLSLLHLPYKNMYYDRSLDPYSSQFVDFFQDFADRGRTCEAAGVPLPYCSCFALETIEYFTPPLTELLQYLAEEAVLHMNLLVEVPRGLCQKLRLAKVTNALGSHFSDYAEQLKLQFTVEENSKAMFEAVFVVGTQLDLLQGQFEGATVPVMYNGVKTTARVRFT